MATLGQLSPHRLSGDNSTLAFDVERVRKDFPVLAEHVHALVLRGKALDFELIRGWDAIAEMRWDVSYRGDERNWRNVYGC